MDKDLLFEKLNETFVNREDLQLMIDEADKIFDLVKKYIDSNEVITYLIVVSYSNHSIADFDIKQRVEYIYGFRYASNLLLADYELTNYEYDATSLTRQFINDDEVPYEVNTEYAARGIEEVLEMWYQTKYKTENNVLIM